MGFLSSRLTRALLESAIDPRSLAPGKPWSQWAAIKPRKKGNQMNEKKTANQKRRLSWKVVGEDGSVLAIVDSESEAFFFTRYRAHAASAETVFSGIDYSAAPELLEALERIADIAEGDGMDFSRDIEDVRIVAVRGVFLTLAASARAALAKARGEKGGGM